MGRAHEVRAASMAKTAAAKQNQGRIDSLKNTDFTSGLDGWKATGDIKKDSFPGYGGNSLGLWSSNSGKVGDDFAVFTRHEGKANVLEQTAKGLVKGKKYCLFFHTGDLDDIVSGRPEPRRVPISVSLTNAEILKKTHFCPPSRSKTTAASNTEKIIFTATGSEVKLTFTDTKAAAVRALYTAGIINGVSATEFKPDGLLTRAQMAKIIWKLRTI